jgi:hypothetical protein
MSVKIVKLLNGEDLIAKIVPSSELIVKMENPVRIVVMPNKIDPKTPNVGLAPWAEFSDDKVFILDKSHVLCIMTPVKEFINQYNSIFGGLVLPTGNLITPGT